MKTSSCLSLFVACLMAGLLMGCPPVDFSAVATFCGEVFDLGQGSQIVTECGGVICLSGVDLVDTPTASYRVRMPDGSIATALIRLGKGFKTWENSDAIAILLMAGIGFALDADWPWLDASEGADEICLSLPMSVGVIDVFVVIPTDRGDFFFTVIYPDDGVEIVIVPDLTGLNWAQAEALVEPLGLSIPSSGVTTEASSTVPANIIIRWSPTGSVPVGTAISIVVSTGPPAVETAQVPNLSGQTEDEARDTIMGTCLTVGTVTYTASNTIPSGQVISWSPTGEQPCGTAVSIVVSTGPAVTMVTVPNLVGLTKIDAIAALTGIGLVVGTVTVEGSTLPKDNVLNYDPKGSVPLGTTVSLVVSSGPALPPGQLGVKILSPEAGQVYTVGEQVLVSARVTGDPGKGPFKLVLSCAGKSLPTQVFTGLSSGDQRSVTFELTLPGSAWFNAYLEDKNGDYATDGVAYFVVSP